MAEGDGAADGQPQQEQQPTGLLGRLFVSFEGGCSLAARRALAWPRAL